jgi:hypothetical protein
MTAAEAAQKDAEKADKVQKAQEKAAEKAGKEEAVEKAKKEAEAKKKGCETREAGEAICVGSKRRRASTVNYKQLAGIGTRTRRTKEEIEKEKTEKERRRESKQQKTRRLAAEIVEALD